MDKKIKTNAIFNLIYQLTVIIIPLITTPYVSRVLGVSNVGTYSYTLSIVSYFTLFAAFGLNSYGQRETARFLDDKNKISKLFFELACNRFLTTGIVLIVYFILTFTALEKDYMTYYLIMSMNVVAIAFDITWFFQGVENFKTIAVRNMAIKLLSAICIFLFVKDSDDLILYFLINSIALILSALSVWVLVPKYVNKVKIEFKSILYHFKGSLVYFIPTIAIQIYTILDKSMIQWITGSVEENGLYDQAEKIVKVAITIIQFLNVIMTSRMSFLYQNKRFDEAKVLCEKSYRLLSLLMFPLCLGSVLVAPNLIPLYLGEGYEGSILLMQIFSPLIIFIGLSGYVGSHYMTPIGKQNISNIALIIGACINFILNMIFIRIYEANGAAIASVIAECFIAFAYIFNARKFINPKSYLKISYKHIIASIIMFLSTYYICNLINFNNLNLNVSNLLMIFIKAGLGASIYFIVLLILFDRSLFEYINKGLNILKNIKFRKSGE